MAQLDSAFPAWKAVPAVAEFRETFDATILHEA